MNAPTRKLTIGPRVLTLMASVGGFRRFKTFTRELGLGKLDRYGRPRGLSVLQGDLVDGLDEETIGPFIACLALEPDVMDDLEFLEDHLSDPKAMEAALEVLLELIQEAAPDEDDPDASDSEGNQNEAGDDQEAPDPMVETPSSSI